MKIFKNRNILLLFAGIFLFTVACEKDEDEPDANNNNNNSSSSGSGGADVNITGNIEQELGDYATWEITEDQLLRIRLGSEFPENIVLNYRLGSNAVSDFQSGSYTAVSATYTGQPADEIAFQYNGDDPQFPDSGMVTITDVSSTLIEGELDVTMSPIVGSPSQVVGSFAAEPLE